MRQERKRRRSKRAHTPSHHVRSGMLRRAIGVTGVSAILFGLSATPSSAADELITTNMTCQYSLAVSRTMSPGDTLTFRMSQTGALTTYHCEQALYASTASGSLEAGGTTITSLSDGFLTISSWPTDVVFTAGSEDTSFQFRQGGLGTITVTITAAAVPASAVEPPSGPADLLQQVELPASGRCADVDTSSVGQFSEVEGGWGASWAVWPNAGSGGGVCTRTFHFSPATQTWDLML